MVNAFPAPRLPRTLAVLATLALVTLMGDAAIGIQGPTQDDLFNLNVVHRIDLNVHSADWAKLKQNFRENDYYPADFTFNGESVRNVGIRSRGTGSRNGDKPALRVDFNRYSETQRFLGLKALVLRNQFQDASQIHEPVAMWFYGLMGVPAPRVGFTRLYVNGGYAGLYAVDEEVDQKMLTRLFGVIENDGQNDGYLYEFNRVPDTFWHLTYFGSALEPYKIRFTPKTHESKSDEELFRPIETLVRLINVAPADGLAGVIQSQLDVPAFMRFLAVQTLIAENDGFTGNWGTNNFYLYRLENSAKHVVIAWDASQAFNHSKADILWRFGENVLVWKLMQIPAFRDIYFNALDEAADLAGRDNRLDNEIRRQLDLIDTSVRADTVKPFTDSEFASAGTIMRQFAGERVAYVKCEVSRLTGRPRNSC